MHLQKFKKKMAAAMLGVMMIAQTLSPAYAKEIMVDTQESVDFTSEDSGDFTQIQPGFSSESPEDFIVSDQTSPESADDFIDDDVNIVQDSTSQEIPDDSSITFDESVTLPEDDSTVNLDDTNIGFTDDASISFDDADVISGTIAPEHRLAGTGALLEPGPDFNKDVKTLVGGNLGVIEHVVFSANVPSNATNLAPIHKHTGNSKDGGGCYTKADRTETICTHTLKSASRIPGTAGDSCGPNNNDAVRAVYGGGTSGDGEYVIEHTHSWSNTYTHTVITTKWELACGYENNARTGTARVWWDNATKTLYIEKGAQFPSDCTDMFSGMTKVKSIDLTGYNVSGITNTTSMFPASIDTITLPETFKFSDSTPQGATHDNTKGSGLTDHWHKDGSTESYPSQIALNTTLFTSTFEGKFNQNANAWAGTWVKGTREHYYWAKGQAATVQEGNIWEIHHPESRFFGYCFAQHLSGPNGRYERILVDDIKVLKEVLGVQNYVTKPAGNTIQEALITMLYFGYPNNGGGIQQQFGLTDSEFSKVTWGAVGYYETDSGSADIKKLASGQLPSEGYSYRGLVYSDVKYAKALQALINSKYADIPANVKNNLHLYIYVSQQHQQHLIALEGLVHGDYSGVEVQKVDVDTGLPISGAEFTVYDSSNKAVLKITSNSDGIASVCRLDDANGLRVGTYTIKETKAPSGYNACPYYYTFKIDAAGKIITSGVRSDNSNTERMVFQNKAKGPAGGIKMRKVSTSNSNLGLPGAVYGLYQGSTLITKLHTDSDGYASTSKNALPLGDYTLKEITAPAGYLISDEAIPVSVTAKDTIQAKTYTVADPMKTGKGHFELTKVIPDKPNGGKHTMKAGRFNYELYAVTYTANGSIATQDLVGKATNDAEGKIVFPDMTFNSEQIGQHNYIVKEIPNNDTRYEYDDSVLKMQMIVADDGSNALVCTPSYNEIVFTNIYTEPKPVEVKKMVSGGTMIEEGVHNGVNFMQDYGYDIVIDVPDQVAENRYASFKIHDTVADNSETAKPEAIGGEITVKTDGISVTKDGAAMDGWKVSATKVKSLTENYDVYDLNIEYTGNLDDAGFYGHRYVVHIPAVMNVNVKQEAHFFNGAEVSLTYKDTENEPETLVTNEVRTDTMPFFPDNHPEVWPVKKAVYDESGLDVNLENVLPNEILTYVITCENTMEYSDGIATVTDKLPNGVTFVSADNGGLYTGQDVVWERLDFPAKSKFTVSYKVKVNDIGAISDIDNTATVSVDPVGGNTRTSQKTNTVHNFVPDIVKIVTDKDGNNINGALVNDGDILYYHLYVINSDTAGNNPKRTGVHDFTTTDNVPANSELCLINNSATTRDAFPLPTQTVVSMSGFDGAVETENAKSVNWTDTFQPMEVKEYSFAVKAVGKSVLIVNNATTMTDSSVSDVKPLGNVFVVHKDIDTGAVLKEMAPVAKNEHIGTEYTTSQETFSGYHFVKVDENMAPANGTVKPMDQIVVYWYSKDTADVEPNVVGNVLVIHKAEDTGEILQDISYVKKNAPIGDAYETSVGEFAGYTFSKMDVLSAPAAGSVEPEDQVVIYLYNRTGSGTGRTYPSNEVVNGVPEDPAKMVRLPDGTDINQNVLQVGDTYYYQITLDNPTSYKKVFTLTDAIATDEIEVLGIDDGTVIDYGDMFTPGAVSFNKTVDITDAAATEAGTHSYVDGTITWVSELEGVQKKTFTVEFKPLVEDVHWENMGHASVSQKAINPDTEEVIPDAPDVTWEKDTNIVENWTAPAPVKTVIRKSDNKDMDTALVWGENADVLQYTVEVRNPADIDKNFTVTDVLDEDLEFVNASDNGTYDKASRTITWQLKLAGEETKTVTFDAKVSVGNAIASANNTAESKVDYSHIPSNTTDTDIDETPTKTVTDKDGKDIDDFLVNKDDVLTYTIRVKNPDELTKQFVVEDIVPEYTELIDAKAGVSIAEKKAEDNTAAAPVSTVAIAENRKSIKWTADIPSGDEYAFVFTVKANIKGSYIPNEATVTVDDSSIKTNLVENWVPEDPLKAVTEDGKDINKKVFFIGDENVYQYEITVKNPSNIKKMFTVTDVLDENLEFVSASDNGKAEKQKVTWFVDVEAEKTKVVTVKVRIIDKPTKTKIPNVAHVACDNWESDTNQVVNYVTTPPVKAVKLDNTDIHEKMIYSGGEYTYTITFKNPTEAEHTYTITDVLQKELTFVSADNGGSASGQTVTWNGIKVKAGEEITLSMNVKTNAEDVDKTIDNVANVKYADSDPEGPKNYDHDTNKVTVYLGSVEKKVTDGQGTSKYADILKVGDKVTYELKVGNPSKSDQVVTVTDELPAGMTFVSATDGGSASGQVVTFKDITIPAGGKTLKIVVSLNESAPKDTAITNTFKAEAFKTERKSNEVINFRLEAPVKSVSSASGDANGQTVEAKTALTYKIDFKNPSDREKTFTIKDTADGKLKVLSVSNGGRQSGNEITWTIKVPAKSASSVSFTAEAPNGKQDSVIKNKAELTVDKTSLESNEVTTNVKAKVEDPNDKDSGSLIARITGRGTGDSSHLAIWVTLLAVGLSLTGLLIWKKRRA